MRADSFVTETDIHYPTESSLIWDGVRKIIPLCYLGLAVLGRNLHVLGKLLIARRDADAASAFTRRNAA